MTRPSVRVSFFRLVSTALVLILLMNWVGRQLGRSINQQSLKVVEDWPTTFPKESRRIHSLDGLSIVSPPGWHASISDGSIRLVAPAVPEGFLGPSEIQVNRVVDPYRHPQPLPLTTPFKDGRCCLKILHVRSTHRDPVRHEAHVVVEHDDSQYEVIFRTHKYFTKRVPNRIWNYLETFEKDDRPDSLTASLY